VIVQYCLRKQANMHISVVRLYGTTFKPKRCIFIAILSDCRGVVHYGKMAPCQIGFNVR